MDPYQQECWNADYEDRLSEQYDNPKNE